MDSTSHQPSSSGQSCR